MLTPSKWTPFRPGTPGDRWCGICHFLLLDNLQERRVKIKGGTHSRPEVRTSLDFPVRLPKVPLKRAMQTVGFFLVFGIFLIPSH